MEVRCPKCDRLIDPGDVNVGADTVFCRKCDEAFKLSELVRAEETIPVDLSDPPKGAWFEKTFDGFVIGATTRTLGALFLLPFTLVWSGFSLGGIYGTQIYQGEFSLVFSLFGIPFLIGSMVLWTFTLMSICGKVSIEIDGYRGRLFLGIGSLGRTKHFNWLDISEVREVTYQGSDSTGSYMKIAIEGSQRIEFGRMLSASRRHFMLQALRQMLAERSSAT